ncbi:phage head closure protein [Fructilactobacillus sp. Tb1]|uniref:phage head closure protein n=1 Tax=Fructilactobacillus sp. Tb1 TaxID=3422304 RepID=UPI003D2C6B8B
MAKKYLYSDFNIKADFGYLDSVNNDKTGSSKRVFTSLFQAYCFQQIRTRSQNIVAIGMKVQDQIDLVIKRNGDITKCNAVEFNGNRYEIVTSTPYTGIDPLGYDRATIQLIRKKG